MLIGTTVNGLMMTLDGCLKISACVGKEREGKKEVLHARLVWVGKKINK